MKPDDEDDILDEHGLGGSEVSVQPEHRAEVTSIDLSDDSFNSFGSGIQWETTQKAVQYTLQVNFVATGTFMGTIFGKPIT